nr:2397_t:CDS:2 [Entrophospora candida]
MMMTSLTTITPFESPFQSRNPSTTNLNTISTNTSEISFINITPDEIINSINYCNDSDDGSIHKLKSNDLEIKLVEPIVFFRDVPEEAVGSILRGELILHLNKPTKIKKLEMKFVGTTKVLWSGDKKTVIEEREVFSHNWKFITANKSPPTSSTSSLNSPSFNKFNFLKFNKKFHSDSSNNDNNSNLLQIGVYTYPFELYLPGHLPETLNTDLGSVNYFLTAKAIRSGLKSNLRIKQNIEILRTIPDHINSQGIGFARDFNDLLSYEISLPKKAFPLGQSIPIDMKICPNVKKLKVKGVKIQIIEKTTCTSKGQNFTNTRIPVTQELPYFGKETLLEDQEDGDVGNVTYQQIMDVNLPVCSEPVHYSCSTSLINVSHDLKFSFAITLPQDPPKNAELKLNIPITLLSCKAIGDFIALPNYEDNDFYCPCNPAYQRTATIAYEASISGDL